MSSTYEVDQFKDRLGHIVKFKDTEMREQVDELISMTTTAIANAESALSEAQAALAAIEATRTYMEELVNGAVARAETATEAAEDAAQTAETAAQSAQEALEALVIDDSLSVSGQAADAKATGDALATKQNTLSFDNAPTSGSTNPVTSGGVKTALDEKQNTLTFDTTPTSGSTNPVTSGGVNAQLINKIPKEFKSGALSNYLQNNGATNTSGKYALDAAYGKTLQDSINSLNSSMANWKIVKATASAGHFTINMSETTGKFTWLIFGRNNNTPFMTVVSISAPHTSVAVLDSSVTASITDTSRVEISGLANYSTVLIISFDTGITITDS